MVHTQTDERNTMKPQKLYQGTVEGDLDGYEIEMTLDDSPAGRAHLMSLMTDLYSDPHTAVVREISTNALDSHIEAGSTRPIEVFTPTALSPYFAVRDFGVGLSLQDLEKVFSRYGASTKRDTDSQTGTLGLGCKSPLTVSPQFTVTSTKGGVQYQIVVTRNDEGVGVLEVVDSRATDGENGVEVRIPMSTGDLGSRVDDFFYYWRPGTVLVNGEQPNSIFTDENVVKIGENVFVREIRRYYGGVGDDVIVMGNVAYPLKDSRLTEISANGNYRKATVAFVEMGDVMFAPSREALAYTPRTMACLERVEKEIQANIEKSVKAEFNGISSYKDAFRIWQKWVGVVGEKAIPDITFNGHKFDSVVRNAGGFVYKIEGGKYNYRAGTYSDRMTDAKTFSLAELLSDDSIIVTGYTNATAPAGNARLRIKQYIAMNNLDSKNVWLFDELPGRPWTSELPTVSWDTIAAIKLPKGAGGGSSGPIPILAWSDDKYNGQWQNKTIVIDQAEKVLFVSPANDVSVYSIRNVVKAFPKAQIILLGSNRWAKFKRENAPKAVDFLEYYHGQFHKDILAMITDDEKAAAELADEDKQFGKRFKGVTFDDPKVNEIIRLSSIDTELVRLYTSSKPHGEGYMDANYPLTPASWGSVSSTEKEHTQIYINAVFSRKDK
jgi:hypothetical protein